MGSSGVITGDDDDDPARAIVMRQTAVGASGDANDANDAPLPSPGKRMPATGQQYASGDEEGADVLKGASLASSSSFRVMRVGKDFRFYAGERCVSGVVAVCDRKCRLTSVRVRPHHRGRLILEFPRCGPRAPSGARLQLWSPVAFSEPTKNIALIPLANFSWNCKEGVPEMRKVEFSVQVKRRSGNGGYEWVVDWYDPRREARFEAAFPTWAEASACKASVLAELTL